MKNAALVVEEEDLVRSLVDHVLHVMDFEVLDANSEEKAFDLFCQRESEISYVYIDYNLRRGNGMNLYQKIRERNPNVYIVISSGMPDNGLLTLNVDPLGQFLPKPFSLDSLLDTVPNMNGVSQINFIAY